MDVQTGTSTLGPYMPAPLAWQCVVKLNSTKFITGGYNGTTQVKSTSYYDAEEKIFKAGPDLMVKRREHGCGIITNSNGSYVVVTGGYYGSGLESAPYMNSTEYLDLGEPTIWKTGQKVLNRQK